jgi:hypothetical protein
VVTLYNGFEGGTSGVTITAGNSGGASGNAFDTVVIGSTTATLIFDNAHAAHGGLSAKVATGAAASTVLMEWTNSEGTVPTIYYRMYLYSSGTPTLGVRLFTARTSAALAAALQWTNTGTLELINGGNSVVATFAGTVPANQWIRIEGQVTGNASTGVLSATQYNSADSVTGTETQTVSNANTTGSLAQFFFGENSANAAQGPFWLDDIGIATSGSLGPYQYTGTGTAALTLTATSAGSPVFSKGHLGFPVSPVLVAAGII